ncbi:MAG: pyridoxal-phosphate dependent enzyme [Acidimicrobiaceae bacterium]|nr:pyridoxal-phosphate dependent enzyme [Acidimicrobiaceae bacterium]
MEAAQSTFEHYAPRLETYRLVEAGTVSAEAAYRAIRDLDEAVGAVEGRGFEPTPFGPAPELAAAAGIGDSELWVKDETGNVSGSHKARHLFGVALTHRLEDADAGTGAPPYAIASCGNAALAAAVVARAVGRPIDVFVPTWANEAVLSRISELGGRVVRCERDPGVPGDPAHHAMLAAIEAGAVPFSCQGTETPATIDGGRTLAWEMVDVLVGHDGGRPARLDRLFVQVGGGALATAAVTGLADAVARGDLDRLPRVHAVQPEGNHPLVRAWDTLVLELRTQQRSGGRDRDYFMDRIVSAQAAPQGTMDNRLRSTIAQETAPMSDDRLQESVGRLRYDPERYMRAWEQEPVSYASGILDDITYDWIDVVEAMLASGGWPLVASEDNFRRAHRLAHEHTGIDVCPTGASGLGGLLALNAASEGTGSPGVSPGERVAVLFTGRMRPGDPDPLVSAP